MALGIALIAALPVFCQTETEDAPPPAQPSAPSAQAESPTPEAAQGSFVRRARKVGDALRGLATWDLFHGQVTLRAYTRLQVDATLARGDGQIDQTLGDIDDSSLRIRRFNLYAAGTIKDHLDYEVGYLFGPDRSIWNAFVQGTGAHGLKVFGFNVGNFRAGYFQEPFSVERNTSSYYTGFAERSLPVWAFAPGNNVGYMVYDTEVHGRVSWAAGIFSFGQATELNPVTSNLSADFKLNGRPLYRDEGRRLVHLGMAFSSRQPTGETVRFRVRPEARFVDFFADTGDIPASLNRLYQAEAVSVLGPLWLQAETIVSEVVSTEDRLRFSGGYFQGGYFLTGEVRPFNTLEGYFGRVIPRGKNALEVVWRVSTIDLSDEDVRGGEFVDLGVGINWYFGTTSRLLAQYTRSRIKNSGDASIAILRFSWRPRSR